MVELKTFSPLCDPTDGLEQAVVSAAVREIRNAQMTRQVFFDSFSPALLLLASQIAPEIPRELDLSGLQLLTPEQVTAITGLPVKIAVEELKDGPFEGTITRYAHALDEATKTMLGEIELPNPKGDLRPGMSLPATR